MRGRIVKALSGFYYVRSAEEPWTGGGVYAARARGIFKKEGITPLVGDEVEFDITHEEDMEAFVTKILPRKNSFIRPPIANVDILCIVVSAGKPEPSPPIVDRLLVMAEEADTEAVIVVNKIDAAKEKTLAMLEDIYAGIYPLLKISAKTGDGKEILLDTVGDKNAAFCGASGVGKSTIVNMLKPVAGAETGGLSDKTGRGKNTTRHVESFGLETGGRVFATPGFTSFEIPGEEEADLQYMFPEMRPYIGKCRFDNCRHLKEPGCAVTEALAEGKIHRSRYDSYVTQLAEIRENNSY